MTALAVFVASMLGSPHCAGMCGGFLALCATESQRFLFQFYYNMGRLTSYLILGCVAGMLGSTINDFGLLFGIQQVAGLVLGVVCLVWGFRLALGVAKGAIASPSHLGQRIYQAILKRCLWQGMRERSFLVGILSAFLPCSWLYTYVIVAAGTGSAISGVLLMTAFWLGTLPVMLSTGFLLSRFSARFQAIAPRATAILLVVAGCFSVLSHFDAVPFLSLVHNHSHH